MLFKKLEKIEIISSLDYKILWRYDKLLGQLKCIINVQIITELIRVMLPRISYRTQGSCNW